MNMPFKEKRIAVGLIIATAIGIVLCLAFVFDLFYTYQQRGTDFYFQAANLHRNTEPQEDIVILSVDDKSLSDLGHILSWPRSHYARVIDALAEAKTRVIVFDLLFAEPAPGDEELATAIENAGNVVLPVISTSTSTGFASPRQLTLDGGFIEPLDIFQEAAAARGHANVNPDADGIVRRLSIALSNDNDYEPALALAAVAQYLRRPRAIESPVGDKALSFAGRSIPLAGNNEMLVNYMASPQGIGGIVNFPIVSLVDVLRGDADPSLFRDKIVIIGATASGLGDTFWTPIGSMISGVEVHASAMHTILTGNFLKTAPSAITIALILLLALLCGIAVLYLRVLIASLAAISLCAAYFFVAFFLFDNGILLNTLYPPLSVITVFAGLNLHNLVAERSEKRKITDTFGRYISPPVVAEIMTNLKEGRLELGGKEHEVTVAFADVRAFTSISEEMAPAELVTLLNSNLTAIIEAVLKFGGMINKFGGDSVMAIWNAPLDCKGHPLLAIKAAMSAQSGVKKLNEKEKNTAGMQFGIGINTGKVLAGNLGSEDRLEYSVVGDAVNVAARLAGATPGGKVWIGADTYELVKDDVIAKPLKPLTVKGRREEVQAYEVLDIKNDETENEEIA
jgi:adenylate cyclase